MWELDHKEVWALNNWCLRTVRVRVRVRVRLGEDSWESLGQQEDQTSQSVLKINPEYSLEGLILKHILWPPDVKNGLIRKDSDARKDWRQKEKGTTEDEMVRWHHWLNGHEFDKLQEMEKDREACRDAAHGVSKSWTRLSNWTTAATCSAKEKGQGFSFFFFYFKDMLVP